MIETSVLLRYGPSAGVTVMAPPPRVVVFTANSGSISTRTGSASHHSLKKASKARARIVAEHAISLSLGAVTSQLTPLSEAWVWAEGESWGICALRGEISVDAQSDDGLGDSTPSLRINTGFCLRSGDPDGISEVRSEERASSDLLASVVEGVLSGARVELGDVIGALSEQLDDVESRISETVTQGPRLEAQSCGCSETSSGGGPNGWSGSTSSPDPEPPEPGHLRIRVVIPRR